MNKGLTIGAALTFVCAAQAALFSDDFESGLGQWNAYYGQIVVDPLNGSNNCLSFSGLNAGGDTFSIPGIPIVSGNTYIVSFRYLGLPIPGVSNPNDTGGYFGLNTTDWYGGNELWVYATGNDSGAADVLIDDGQWHSYSFAFDDSVFPFSEFHVKFEDYINSGGTAGDAYFDDVNIEAVPEPASLTALGFAAIALLRRRRS